MAAWLDRLGVMLLDATLAATAITGFVVLAMIQFRQPARRLGWARAGVLSTLALLPLAALNPIPRIDLRAQISSILSSDPFEEPSRESIRGEIRPVPSTPKSEEVCRDQDVSALSGLRRVGRIVVVLYLVGLSIGLGWIGLGLWGVERVVRRASDPSPGSLALYNSLILKAIGARPRLLVSEQAGRPVLVGSFRPVILISPDFDGPGSTDRLRLGLLHELAHIENLDHRFNPVSSMAEAIWFFLPTFWWIREQMKLDQEFLADRRAVSLYGTSKSYAATLVNLASIRADDREGYPRVTLLRPTSSVGVMASALFQRVQMLLRCPFPIEGETPLWWRWTTALTLVVATLATSCLTLRGLEGWWESPQRPPAESTHTFRLAELVIEPRDSQDRAFDLHYRLPVEFTLTLEVLAEPSELPTLEILGHRLALTAPPSADPQGYRLWHRVRIRRLHGFDFVEVDEHVLRTEPLPDPTSPWLTIRALPEHPTRIRDLKLDW